MPAAVLADMIGSRLLEDRPRAQRDLDEAIAHVGRDLPVALQPLKPTVGDEQQGVYPTLESAMASLLLLRLALPEGLDLRFGIGLGDVGVIAAAGGAIPDGPGWWAARDAIDVVHDLQKRTAPSARTWVVAGPGEDAPMPSVVQLANAYLLARDHVVGAMSARARRLTYGRCLGVTQSDLARAEGITQSAVSQTLGSAGAHAIVEGFALITAGGEA